MNTCYTVITNNYDTLKKPYVSPGWEYIVFSDHYISDPIWNCTVTSKHNRDVKIRAHNELHENLTLYVDGSIEIIGDLNAFCSEVPNWFSMWKHPHRDSIFQEAEAVIRLKGMDRRSVYSQMKRYKKRGYNDIGLAACGVMLRDLSDSKVREICDDWYDEWLLSCGRDQLSLPYVFWKHGYEMDLFDNNVFNKYFRWLKHG